MQLHSSNLIQLCKLPISLTDAFFRSAFEVSENFIKIKKTIYIIYLLNQIPYSIMIKCTKYLTKAQESKYWISHWEIQPLIVTSQFLRYKRDAYNVAESLEKKNMKESVDDKATGLQRTAFQKKRNVWTTDFTYFRKYPIRNVWENGHPSNKANIFEK